MIQASRHGNVTVVLSQGGRQTVDVAPTLMGNHSLFFVVPRSFSVEAFQCRLRTDVGVSEARRAPVLAAAGPASSYLPKLAQSQATRRGSSCRRALLLESTLWSSRRQSPILCSIQRSPSCTRPVPGLSPRVADLARSPRWQGIQRAGFRREWFHVPLRQGPVQVRHGHRRF
eukprot:SAG11_NODE_603_length_8247_cov_13.668385_2_plen_172_part_00